MIDNKSLKNKILSINTIDEMETFIEKNIQAIITYFFDNGIDKELISKMFTNVSNNFIYDLYYCLIENLDDYKLLIYIYDKDQNLAKKIANILIEEDISLIESFYKSCKNKPQCIEIIKSFSINQKGLLLSKLSSSINYLIESNAISKDELIQILSNNEINISTKNTIFNNLNIYYKKTIIMDNTISKEDIICFMKDYYNKQFNKDIKDEINDFILNSFITSYENGSKTSFLLLIDLIEQKMKSGVVIDYTDSRAYFNSDIDQNNYSREIENISLERKYVQGNIPGVLFHEFGHFLFKTIRKKRLPENFSTIMTNSQNEMIKERKEEINKLLSHTLRMKKTLFEKSKTKAGSKIISSIFSSYIKDDLKKIFIKYMQENGYSKSLINIIINRFDSLDISILEELEIAEDQNLILDIITEYFMCDYKMAEDIINSIFAGDSSEYYYQENATYGGFGHPEEYYKHNKKETLNLQFNEGFANFVSLVLTGNKKLLDLLRSLIGEDYYKLFEKILLESACYGIPEEDKELREKIKSSLYHDNGKDLEKDTLKIENLTDEEIFEYLKYIGTSLFSLPMKVVGVKEENKHTKITTDEAILEFFKKEKSIEALEYEFEELSLTQKTLIIKSNIISNETKKTLVKWDLFRTFLNEKQYFTYVMSLLEKLEHHKTNLINSLLLIESLIEIKRTKGHELSEEDFRKAM